MDKTDLEEAQKLILSLIQRSEDASFAEQSLQFANAALAAAQSLNIASSTWLKTPLDYLSDDQPPMQAIYPEPVDPHRRPCWYRERSDAPYGEWVQGWLLKICGDEADMLIETEAGELVWRSIPKVRFSPPDAQQKADA